MHFITECQGEINRLKRVLKEKNTELEKIELKNNSEEYLNLMYDIGSLKGKIEGLEYSLNLYKRVTNQ